MGLDSYWVLPEGVDEPVFDPSLQLCGGLFSDACAKSFRGKVYADLVAKIADVDLYTEILTNFVVKQIADSFEQESLDELVKVGAACQFQIAEDEIKDLRRMFRAYADAGAELNGWW